MSGYGGPAAAAWQEHHTPDGRAYYYNSATKVTQWTKPDDLMTPAERALSSQPWKEYTAEGGRKYWYNTETKQSSWEMPDAYRNAMGQSGGQPSYGQNGGHSHSSYEHPRESRDHRDPRDQRDQRDFSGPDSRYGGYGNESRAQAFIPAASDEPEYASPEEAEAAFVKLLKRCGVQPDWTWEDAMRATIKDPQYRSIRDAKGRRDAFDKYCQDVIVQDRERADERMAKLRADFETMLKRHPEIVHYTRWKTARPMIEGETIFRSTNNEEERRQLFEEYVVGLKKAHKERQIKDRKNALDSLKDLLPRLSIKAYTRWSDAQDIISAAFQKDEKYQALNKYDTLVTFQDHIKSLERSLNEQKQHEKKMKYRRERKARDAFKSLLSELRKDGKIKPGVKWSGIQPQVERDERYRNMLGHDGSTPQELFWDVVEEEERSLRGPRNDVLDVLEDKRFELTPTSDLQEFLSIMKDDRRTANIDNDILQLIFERLREKRAAKRDDDKQSDRQQRRAVEDLRAHLRRLDPPIVSGDTYEKVRSRLLKSEEFQAVSSEDLRRGAFDKHMRRLREKEEDDADRGHRRGSRVSTERETSRRERERSRGERSQRSTRPARRSRSPEQDPYEADRRKAIAERERNHRKSTMAENLLTSDRGGRLSPPPRRERDRDRDRERDRERDRDRDRDRDRERDRDRDSVRDRDRDRERERDRDRDRERDRDLDRPPRSRRDDDSHYDRERKDREDERERQYRRRIDRGSYDELPYGDERPSGSRRRRQEDEDETSRRDSRDSKRLKRDRSRERSPTREGRARPKTPPAAPAKEVVRSGSEEGEIEE
ncbi:formin binding protein (FNB3) [Pochonia chlamydosporia 170]|uniref:Formin binding protein (FNB3) n=1 Tax=Pochonia chlamydosporia 170 TaxID=1380566 RepID=A0A179G313_METCM|nr:formin binding protein (FNB3) [Pochonia chlamydosporia 170]OAQ72147.1 formin binding protein (FNB3) [Pochonia chlamydosporia 170]